MHQDPYAHCPRVPEDGPIDPRRLFTTLPEASPVDENAPVELEIGPGRGWFTVERLEHDPSTRVLGLEIRRKWATIVDERLQKRGLSHRGRVFAEDAKEILPRLSSESVSVAYVHFPDPWWKKRHQKRLVVGDLILEELSRVLIPGGRLLIQTDVFERGEEYERSVANFPAFVPVEQGPRVEDQPFGARSPRERKAMEDGLPIVRLLYKRA